MNQELNGYEHPEQLPDYRILRSLNCRGDFFGPFGHRYKECSNSHAESTGMVSGMGILELESWQQQQDALTGLNQLRQTIYCEYGTYQIDLMAKISAEREAQFDDRLKRWHLQQNRVW